MSVWLLVLEEFLRFSILERNGGKRWRAHVPAGDDETAHGSEVCRNLMI